MYCLGKEQKQTLGKSLQVALREGWTLKDNGNGYLSVTSRFGALTFKGLTPSLQKAFTTLVKGNLTVDELSEEILTTDGRESLTRFYHHFNQLLNWGLIAHTVAVKGIAIATISGISKGYQFQLQDIDPEQPYCLSRFAYCRREDKSIIVESPLGQAQIRLQDWRGMVIISLLALPQSVRQLAQQFPALDEEPIAGCLQLLLNAKALTDYTEESAIEEDHNPTLVMWDFHDLLFHSRSRFGRHANFYGATFRHINQIEPLPAVKPSYEGAKIDLYRPNLEQLQISDLPLSHVIETRRSVYTYDQQPITLKQIGEFLYRVARVRTLSEVQVQSQYVPGQTVMPLSSRPYPSGGKCYELEFYITVGQCEGLAIGLYHYDPLEHQLTQLRERDELVESLLQYTTLAAPQLVYPQVLITLTARFGRVAWKYDAIAYAVTLKHVGVAYQTMYLVATAMGLAPCALGSGDSDQFARAARTDYFAETSVGEFLLGSLPK